MGKKKKLRSVEEYEEDLWSDIEEILGDKPRRLRQMVRKTARDQRHLDQIDDELDGVDLTSMARGSMGQMKQELNPLLLYRDKVSRTVSDDLESLMLTARSTYKKKDNNQGDTSEVDPMAEYLQSIKS